jgi:hypothetical protein
MYHNIYIYTWITHTHAEKHFPLLDDYMDISLPSLGEGEASTACEDHVAKEVRWAELRGAGHWEGV